MIDRLDDEWNAAEARRRRRPFDDARWAHAADGPHDAIDYESRKVKLSAKAAMIDQEKSLISKFGENATKSGATLRNIFEKAIGKSKKKKKEEK